MAYYLYKKIKGKRAANSGPPETKPSCPHMLLRQSEEYTNFAVDGPEAGTAIPLTKLTPGGKSAECAICKAETRRRRVYRWKIIASLFFPYMLATIDLTIVATAVPFIASHFNQLNELNWIVTAFTLTSTALIPTFGQLADVFGRHATLQLAMFLMLVGSTLAAAAQAWGMLLLGRALQGMGSAGLMNTIMIILADKVTLKENAKNNSIFAFVGGVAYAIGPVLGGYLTDANWRYCFVISIPIAVISHIVIFVLLRDELVEGTYSRRGPRRMSFLSALATIDFIGTFLFIAGVALIILATAWGGSTYPWKSIEVIVPLAIGGAFFFLFFVYEYLLEPGSGRVFARIFPQQTPMLPYSMFSRLDTLWLAILQFSAGAAMYSVFYYVGVYFTLVEAYPASKAGVQLLFYIPGLGAGVYLAMFLCNGWPAQTFFPLTLGTFLETAGLAIVTWGIHTQNTTAINAMMVVAGAGTGIRIMPSTLHAVGVWPDRIAAAMSLMRFALPFGGTLAITIMGSVFNNKRNEFSGSVPGGASQSHGTSAESLSFIDDLPQAVQDLVRAAGRDAIMWAYISIMPILGLSVITGLLMGNVWIRKRKKSQSNVEDHDGDAIDDSQYSEVIYVPYLYALFTGRINQYKHISNPSAQHVYQPGNRVPSRGSDHS